MGVKVVNNKEDFNKELSNAGSSAVIVDFFAEWCGPCKMIAPKLLAMSEEVKDVIFLKVDVDTNSEVAEEMEISAMPTFLVFKNSKKVEELVGANEGKLREMVQRYAGTSDSQQQQQ